MADEKRFLGAAHDVVRIDPTLEHAFDGIRILRKISGRIVTNQVDDEQVALQWQPARRITRNR